MSLGSEALGRVEILTGPERRRWRTAAEKFEVVQASLEPGAVIADVARRFSATRQQVYQWRSDFRAGVLQAPSEGAVFAQVALGGSETPEVIDRSTVPETIEIRLRNGRVLLVPVMIERRRLRALIQTVESS